MLLHADNFSIYGGPNPQFMLNGVYAQANCNLVADPDGISGGRVLSQDPYGVPSNSSIPLRYVLQNGAVDTIGLAFRLWLTELPVDDNRKFSIWLNDQSNELLAWLYVTANGRLAFLVQGGSETNYTDVPAITADGWYHIELKYSRVLDSCDYEIRVEGFTVMQETGVDCLPTGVGQIKFESQNVSRNYTAHVKDFVIWDGSGTYNHDFMGSVLVTNLAPASDIALGWTPNTGTEGYSILNDVPPDPTRYISATIDQIGTPYEASMTDLPTDSTTVRGLITYVRAAKTDGGDGSLQVSLISAGDAADGSDRPITVAQTYWRDIFEEDPHVAAPWTPAAANAATLKINRTI